MKTDAGGRAARFLTCLPGRGGRLVFDPRDAALVTSLAPGLDRRSAPLFRRRRAGAWNCIFVKAAPSLGFFRVRSVPAAAVAIIGGTGLGPRHGGKLHRRDACAVAGVSRFGAHVVAVVALAEGPRMMANITGAGALDVAIGAPVEVVFEARGRKCRSLLGPGGPHEPA